MFMQSNYVRNFGYVSLPSLLGAAARQRSQTPLPGPRPGPRPTGSAVRTNNPAST